MKYAEFLDRYWSAAAPPRPKQEAAIRSIVAGWDASGIDQSHDGETTLRLSLVRFFSDDFGVQMVNRRSPLVWPPSRTRTAA